MNQEILSDASPLSGIRVLEFGQIAAGPFAGSLLADLGADVVKIERPDGGDGMRNWPPLSTPEGDSDEVYSENFASLNRNKRSVAFNMKDAGDLEQLEALCDKADVIIENFRAGVLKRLGLGYEVLKARNPKIVYCSISGYGQSGPYASKGAFDVTVQGMSGIMSVTGEDGASPVKCGVPVGDFCAGLYAAYTIVASVMQSRQTGVGRYIDCSMLGSLLGVAALQTSEYFGTGNTPKPMGSAHPRNAPYQAYMAEDTYFIIAAGNDRLWTEVCQAVGQAELATDSRFSSQMLRATNQKALTAILEPLFAMRTAEEWLTEMDSRGVPCSPINTYPEALNDPHVESMGLVVPLSLPNGVETRTTGFPIKMSNFDFSIYRKPPKLGADNEQVMDEWLNKI